jgi:thioredoxin reductase/NAD-dependent dihydropyrimidine dehydrogenase PreA subunit
MGWHRLSILLAKIWPVIALAIGAAIGFWAVRRRTKHYAKATIAYRDAVQNDMTEPATLHPEIDPARCAGCGACVRACPEGEILQMIEHKAVLIAPTKCVGHGECEMACPFAAISLVFGTKQRGKELPRISTNYETNVSGLYIAGELGGMGLIRNAIKQGRLAVEHAARHLSARAPADVDILIVGAGSAGLSASLAAIATKRSYLCIEQNSVGGTIYNFPRQKVVMTQPADVPLVGTMKFPRHKVSKETLLAYWAEVRRRTGLKVKEGCRFLTLRKGDDGVFAVETSAGPIRARKVVLCMGVRGTPRRLNLPNEDLPKVTYNLIEPEQYQGMNVAVVGGGNAAVEAAQHLGRPQYRNRVTLLVRGARLDRCNQENQDIIRDMERKGLVKIAFNTTVAEIHQQHLVVEHRQQRAPLKNDYLFIFAGAELPFKFLQSLGIQTEKKFGEPMRKT